MIRYSTLHQDGTIEVIRELSTEQIEACPFVIFDHTHYREDGTCKCNSAAERARMIAKWGYSAADFPAPPEVE